MKKRKTLRLVHAVATNKLKASTPFVRILPTDFCNLKCSYCWQHTTDKHMMELPLFVRILNNARKLDVGLMSFLGGEPTLWPHLNTAIALCTSHNISTDITTNGSLLTKNRIEELVAVGLDLINISVDSDTPTDYSQKCYIKNTDTVDYLAQLRRDGLLRVRMNSVICKSNLTFVTKLIQISQTTGIPISLGWAMPPFDAIDKTLHFTLEDLHLITDITEQIRAAKASGVQIIDPIAYFEEFPRFLRGEQFWTCNYATPVGWINVDPYGYLRDCTKKFKRIPFQYADLTRQDAQLDKLANTAIFTKGTKRIEQTELRSKQYIRSILNGIKTCN